jgi:magnesium-protoporphyrin O-methyltransferase
MAPSGTYLERRAKLLTYFDRTAVEAWSRLTSDAPVGRIRATVRAGRDRMRATILGCLPGDLRGQRLLDAGCGTGALALEAARRGAEVVAIDLSPTLVELAAERVRTLQIPGSLAFRVGDMLDPGLGEFDFVVAMDSLIHYDAPDAVRALSGLAARTRNAMVFTFAPRTPALAAMHAVGRWFPRAERAPSLEPVAEGNLRALVGAEPGLRDWTVEHTQRISSGFYTSQAMVLRRR